VTAWGNWHCAILAYFDHPITNADTEPLSNLIRAMNRPGRGCSFGALKAEILFTEGPQKAHAVPTRQEEPEIRLGADFPTLAQMIKDGRFPAGINR